MYEANVLVNCLYPPIRLWYKKLGVDEFLYSKYDAAFTRRPMAVLRAYALSSGSARQPSCQLVVPEFSTALLAYSTCASIRGLNDILLRVPRPYLDYTAIGQIGTG